MLSKQLYVIELEHNLIMADTQHMAESTHMPFTAHRIARWVSCLVVVA